MQSRHHLASWNAPKREGCGGVEGVLAGGRADGPLWLRNGALRGTGMDPVMPAKPFQVKRWPLEGSLASSVVIMEISHSTVLKNMLKYPIYRHNKLNKGIIM